MTDDWQQSPRGEKALQIEVTRANRAVFYRTPGKPQTLATGHGESRQKEKS
jgi:hypothetical protein